MAAVTNRFLAMLRDRGPAPMVVAHRGDSYRAPENTLEAAERARQAGADAWEFDVRLTRDKVPIVIHDESLMRTTDVASRFRGDRRGGTGFLVSEFDFDEVRTLDAGSWFVSGSDLPRTARAFGTAGHIATEDVERFASGTVRVPSLREALELTSRLAWMANVELKWDTVNSLALAAAVEAEIHALAVGDRVIVSSFDHRVFRLLSGSSSGIALGVLTSNPLGRPESYVRDVLGADCYHPSAEVLGAGSAASRPPPSATLPVRDEVAVLHDRGVPVLVYTVNDVRRGGLSSQLAAVGVDALITDAVVEMKAWLDDSFGSKPE